MFAFPPEQEVCPCCGQPSFDVSHWNQEWTEWYERSKERKRGDCMRIEAPSCCVSCHDPGRTDTDLEEVEMGGEVLRLCCRASRFVRGEEV